MAKKSGVKEVVLLIIALIAFIAAVIGIYVFPQTVTTILFVVETILFLIIFMGFMSSLSTADSPVREEEKAITPSVAEEKSVSVPRKPVETVVAPREEAVPVTAAPAEEVTPVTTAPAETEAPVTAAPMEEEKVADAPIETETPATAQVEEEKVADTPVETETAATASVEAEKDTESEETETSEQSDSDAEAAAESITVVSAPEDAAVGTGDSVAEAETLENSEPEVKEAEPVKEVTKLKTVLFNEALLEEKENVDLSGVVKETLDEMKPFLTAAGIRTSEVASGDVSYIGSKKLMMIMMKNIVDNAVKYMQRAGNLHITVSSVADDIFIVCKDDGLGIGKDELPYIFDLNFQGSNRVSGNGLGLTQARDIVNAYGGTIYAKSAPGAGMGIYIQLPAGKTTEGTTPKEEKI